MSPASGVRRYCVRVDPVQKMSVIMALFNDHRCRIADDESDAVIWVECHLTEGELRAVPGVLNVIDYIRPRWGDVLNQD